MHDSSMDYISYIINNNKDTKNFEINSINYLEKIYKIISYYEPQQYSYDEIISDNNRRVEFLINAVNIALTNDNMDQNSVDIVLQMFESVYRYLYDKSELEEIEIPDDIQKNLFNRMFIPNYSQIMFVSTLLKENKRIFDLEFDGKDFSQTISDGLHKGITEILKIEKSNISHLLGVTNDGSLYEFYRKVFINNKIKEILKSLNVESINDKNFDYKKFNKEFKKIFGLDYNRNNYIKLINWRFNAKDDYLEKKGINVSKQEKEILNKTCDYTPKSSTLDFYCSDYAIDLLTKENIKVSDFVYEYIRKIVIDKSNNKNGINELKKIFKKEELELILNISINSNKKNIRLLIDRYVEEKKYKFEEDALFKNSFINKFGYSYPLINYNELLSKNVSFYNFSLFKNLNSIIVDYNSTSKKIESNVFLVSFAKKKIEEYKEKAKRLIAKKDKKNEMHLFTDISNNMDKDYFMNLKSLLSFPVSERYYFRYGFISRKKRIQDDEIIEENFPKRNSITLIGFKDTNDEEERLRNIASGEMTSFSHYLTCETNITTNFHQYITDFTRNGIEYPIDIIVENDNKSKNKKKTKIVKISNLIDSLNKYIDIFNSFQYNEKIGYEKNIEYEKWLMNKIRNSVYDFKKLKETKIKALQYRLNNEELLKQQITEYEKIINYEKTILNDIESYYAKIDNYFHNYNEYMDKEYDIKEKHRL